MGMLLKGRFVTQHLYQQSAATEFVDAVGELRLAPLIWEVRSGLFRNRRSIMGMTPTGAPPVSARILFSGIVPTMTAGRPPTWLGIEPTAQALACSPRGCRGQPPTPSR